MPYFYKIIYYVMATCPNTGGQFHSIRGGVGDSSIVYGGGGGGGQREKINKMMFLFFPLRFVKTLVKSLLTNQKALFAYILAHSEKKMLEYKYEWEVSVIREVNKEVNKMEFHRPGLEPGT